MRADRHDLRGMAPHASPYVRLSARSGDRAALRWLYSSLIRILTSCSWLVWGCGERGELVTEGGGIAFVCLEHFTGVTNPETQGLGLDPELIPLWLAHEIAHAVRYTSPRSRSELRQLIEDAGGYYSYWDDGRELP